MSWKDENPQLWDAMTTGFGTGWWDKTVDEIYAIKARREANGECPFCAKKLSKMGFLVHEVLPQHGVFCSEICAHNDLAFYCIVEGK